MLKKKFIVMFVSILLVSAGCGDNQGSTNTDAEQVTEITFAEPARILSLAPLYVAIEQGFLKEEGIEANISSGGGGAQVTAALLSGEAQFAASGPRSMFTPLEKGEDLVAIQSLNSALTFEIALSDQYMKEKNISADAPLEDRIAGLNGATIGTNVVGDSGDVYTRYLMKLHGEDPSTLETVKLSGTGAKIGGMKEGTVNGGIASPPFALQSQEEEAGQLAIKASEEPTYANMVWEVIFADREYLEENHDTAKKVVRAIGKGIEFTRENPDESADSIASYFDGTDVEIIEESLIGLKETFKGYGEMNQEAWDNAQDPLVEYGEMSGVNTKHNTEPDGIWTNDYIDEAFSTNE
ncbi:ABC transporter substrate-binding protein [Alteribacillus bidgolensis]|uniref:ABC-type nitrate/sulfonate/bicarbonate transport system, substrate-binding protein n=1 Tax=Alteribacillus bidgolensis TaxID=930129 RepID=A0A1G8FRA5_9BACI|nr:ABC transporter substrate-binding protein [Alteribacillus bidgolensis]SDH84682.1 ABC-type nitrate/sulfonate/bicarbonate transport system, substrate-binding protein [Alteribacillus bidgolensis]